MRAQELEEEEGLRGPAKCGSCGSVLRPILCTVCNDTGVTDIAGECGIVCTACNGAHRVVEVRELHMIFHPSVPENERGVLNTTLGILYNDYQLGKNPTPYTSG